MDSKLKKPRARKKPKAEPAIENTFTCEFCKKAYKQERSFYVHMCAAKERYLTRDEKHVKTAFWVFQKFYDISYPGKRPRTYNDFSASRHYTDFVRFGRYLLDTNAINPKLFVEFLIKAKVPIKKWDSRPIYESYVRELNKLESADAAIERNILLMQQWAMDSGEHWSDFFRKVSPALATLWIMSGRISPWVLYTAQSAKDLMARMSPEQMKMVHRALDPEFWEPKLESNLKDVELIRETLAEAGV